MATKRSKKKHTTVLDLLSEHVAEIITEVYKDDLCSPQYSLSEMRGDIVLTLWHMGHGYSTVIDLQDDIEQYVTRLYNQTM